MTDYNIPLLSSTPIARSTDPESSHEAAAEVTENGTRASQQQEVLRLVEMYPRRTSLELSKLGTLDRYQLARRLPELKEAGLVRHGMMRRCSEGKRSAVEWYIERATKDEQGELF